MCGLFIVRPCLHNVLILSVLPFLLSQFLNIRNLKLCHLVVFGTCGVCYIQSTARSVLLASGEQRIMGTHGSMVALVCPKTSLCAR